MSNCTVVILAGGQGARFWPISRMKRPKQFLSISQNGESLIQATARRVEPLTSKKDLLIVTNVIHEPLIREHVPYASVVSEPIGRNTAVSIGLAAIHLRKGGKDPIMVVLPADHAVQNEASLVAAIESSAKLAAEKDLLVSIGIPPTFPHTGYGYIKKGRKINGRGFEVGRFYEKPSLERAVKYFESGSYFWNSGMFVWKTSVILAAIQEFMPQLYEGLLKVEAVLGTAKESAVLKEVLEPLESTSIDFGVMEHARNCAVVPGDTLGWNDVGSWDAWAEHFAKDENNNLLYGDAIVIDAKNCVVHSKNRLVAVLGVDDLVLIDSGDALLVCPRSRVQDVRRVVDELKKKGRNELM